MYQCNILQEPLTSVRRTAFQKSVTMIVIKSRARAPNTLSTFDNTIDFKMTSKNITFNENYISELNFSTSFKEHIIITIDDTNKKNLAK